MGEEGTSYEASSSMYYTVESELKAEYASDTEYTNESVICRVCLKEGDIPIFDTEITDDIVEGLLVFGTIIVEAEDAFPKYLCKTCYELLQGAILLRKTAQQSDELLRQSTEYENTAMEIEVESQTATNEESEREEIILYNIDEDSVYELEPAKTMKVTRGIRRKNFMCKRCDIDLKTYKHYKEHMVSEEHVNKRLLCPVCNKSYAAQYLKKHLDLHLSQTQYICDVCGKEFIQQVQLIRHRLVHFRDLPYKCTECPYRGRLKESLKMHMRVHTGERPYQCAQCPSRFVSKSNLNKHMLTHKEVHDYICDSCGKGFFSKRELDVHIKVEHDGIKEHVCNICNKAFGYRKQMMKHQRKVHKREKLKSGRMPVYLMLEKEDENS